MDIDDQSTRPFVFALAPTLGRELGKNPPEAEPFRLYLERSLAMRVELLVPAGYGAVIHALRTSAVDAAMLGELASRQEAVHADIVPLLAPVGVGPDEPTYRSVIVSRLDSGIHAIAALHGKRVGFVDPQSTSGYLVPRVMVREAGLDPDTAFVSVLCGDHRAVAEAVIAGEIDAGALHERYSKPPSLDRAAEYARLRLIARSEPIPLGPVVVRASLPSDLRQRLVDAMLHMHEREPETAQLILRGTLRYSIAAPRSNPTLKSIAALAGVSYATVSRVINHSGYVAPETAERVEAIVREVGYVPNGHALQLRGAQPPLVAFLVADDAALGPESDAFRARRALSAIGVPMVVCPVARDDATDPAFDLLRDRRFGAVICGADLIDAAPLRQLAREGQLIVALNTDEAPQSVARATDASLVDLIASVLRVR